MRMFNNINFIFKNKKILKIILYLSIIFTLILSVYLSIPKLFDYSTQSIKENLKQNSNIDIKNISKVSYRIFPTPRLKILGGNLAFEGGAIVVENSEIDIILNTSNILNKKKFDYKKLLIKKGTTKVNISSISQFLKNTKQNIKKIFFKDNNLIFIQNNKSLFEINNSLIKINLVNAQQELSINGIFLNHKIFIKLERTLESKNNLIFKIPELDILTKIFFENNVNFDKINGLANFEILNNYLRFNFVKDVSIKISNGFFRNSLINSSLEGHITFKPNFLVKLNFESTILNMEKLFPIIQKKYFLNDVNGLALIKKINGSFNFKSEFDGDVVFENGTILFKNFRVGKDNSLNFDAKINEFGKKGKIQFNLLKTIQQIESSSKQIKISGFIIPSNSRVIFEKMALDDKNYSDENIKTYEKKFENEVVQNSLKNIFNNSKLNRYFKNFLN